MKHLPRSFNAVRRTVDTFGQQALIKPDTALCARSAGQHAPDEDSVTFDLIPRV
jgi:hypothetical protein